jgi:formylglycine-generating enzyme required for sulfatase activity
MAIASVTDLVEVLRSHRLLDPSQAAELPQLQARFPQARALAHELVKRGWLTPYQANQILNGRVQELLLGPYLLLEKLGVGGMGQVFKTRHRLMNRVVALKVIRPAAALTAESVLRFQREIQAAAQLTHPNIVAAYDADLVGDLHFLVMEYVEGIDLHRLVQKQGRLPAGQACDFIRQAALGLQHAFERGLVHRDIKPSNLLLAAHGSVVKLLDLGLAKAEKTIPTGSDATELTQTGVVMGTPEYMAPEQALDPHGADVRADIYSLGCTCYFLLAGRPPFTGGTLAQQLIWHQQTPPPAITSLRPDLPPGLAAVLHKMLAKRPQDRYQTPAEVALALAPFSDAPVAVPASATAPLAIPATTVTPPRDSWTVRAESTVTYAPEGHPTGKPPARPVKLWWLLGAGAGALVLGLLLFFLLKGGGDTDSSGPGSSRGQKPAAEVTNSIGMTFVLIQPGTFTMGSPEADANHERQELPAHEVVIGKPFYLGTCQVTQAQFRQVMSRNPSTFTSVEEGADRCPVETVSWDEAVEFCRTLSALDAEKKAGRVYRLPTEAEWEYACRAGTTTSFSFGNDWSRLGKYGWYKDNTGNHPHPVGRLVPNPWGLYDMHGNVMEWCLDGYDPDFYRRSPKNDPRGPDVERKVLRGGSWLMDARSCRSAHRDWFEHFQRSYQVGFRVLLEVPQ